MTEIFCLEPILPADRLPDALAVTGGCTWKCLIGKGRRWKDTPLEMMVHVEGDPVRLQASRGADAGDGCSLVHFKWEPAGKTFLSVLEHAGAVPLPPYITRDALPADSGRYQTVYAEKEGSVAAPTAGLHFTPGLLKQLRQRSFYTETITLHVGLGTFRPVTVLAAADHLMHEERFSIQQPVIRLLMNPGRNTLTAVGTTTVRTMESLYWLGVRLIVENISPESELTQWYPYKAAPEIPAEEAIGALDKWMSRHHTSSIHGKTRIMIVPGYRFRLTDAMVTNFHQPKSTLLLLVSAFAGNDWRKVYDHALSSGYRFLSYGDACLFLKDSV